MPRTALTRLEAAALLVIDIQNAPCHPEGGFAQAGGDVTAQHPMAPAIARLVRAARYTPVPASG
jgi:nicotinamidase-related amidase